MEIFIEDPCIVRVVNTRDRARHLEHGLAEEAYCRIGRIIACHCSNSMHFTNASRFKNIGINRVAFINHLSGQFLVQKSQQITTVFNHANLVILIDQQIGKTRPCASPTSNQYKHVMPPAFWTSALSERLSPQTWS